MWLPLNQAAKLHLHYAWAAVAAYQDSDDPYRSPLIVTDVCPEPHEFLQSQGWILWQDMPLLGQKSNPESAIEKMRKAHLRAEVWANPELRQVVVAFGGTAGTNLQDWKANFRWILKPIGTYDEYDLLSDLFVPLFVETFKRKQAFPDGEWLAKAKVVSVGHSLGGGLAQQFSYALNSRGGTPRVENVYAFDPSPVSGKRGVDNWEKAANGLTINRIYNRGEILASVRSMLFWKDLPEAQGQQWIDIRYKDAWTWKTLLPIGAVQAHGMFDLACFMKQAVERK
jgi:Lipase (class 3)